MISLWSSSLVTLIEDKFVQAAHAVPGISADGKLATSSYSHAPDDAYAICANGPTS